MFNWKTNALELSRWPRYRGVPRAEGDPEGAGDTIVLFWSAAALTLPLPHYRVVQKSQLFYFQDFKKILSRGHSATSHLYVISTVWNPDFFSHIGVYKLPPTGFPYPLEPTSEPSALITNKIFAFPIISLSCTFKKIEHIDPSHIRIPLIILTINVCFACYEYSGLHLHRAKTCRVLPFSCQSKTWCDVTDRELWEERGNCVSFFLKLQFLKLSPPLFLPWSWGIHFKSRGKLYYKGQG